MDKISDMAAIALSTNIEAHPDKRGGVPVIRGTRFKIAQLLAEFSDSSAVYDIAKDYDLNPKQIKSILRLMATYLDQPAKSGTVVPAWRNVNAYDLRSDPE